MPVDVKLIHLVLQAILLNGPVGETYAMRSNRSASSSCGIQYAPSPTLSAVCTVP